MKPRGPRALACALLPLAVACGASQATGPVGEHGPRCVDKTTSTESESAARAAAPFSDCAAQLDTHCGGDERYALCSFPLDTARTEKARLKAPGICCFGPAE